MIHGGVQPDLLDDTYWWGDIEDFWIYAFYTLAVVVRAAADRIDEPVAVIAARLAAERGIVLDNPK